MNLPKYSLGIILILLCYRFYNTPLDVNEAGLILYFIFLAILSWIVEALSDYPWFKEWLNRYF